MKQKLEDLKLLLKGDRRTQVIVAAVLLVILVSLFMDTTPKKRRPKLAADAPKATQGTSSLASQEAYADIIQRFSADLDDIKDQVGENSRASAEIRQDMMQYEQRTAEIFKKILERMSDQEARYSSAAPTGAGYPAPIDVEAEDMASPMEEEEMESFGLESAEADLPPNPDNQRVAFIGAGDSVRVKLLAGVNAPTDGTPYPVMFKLAGNVVGPDGSTLPLGEARIIAAAQGSLSDSRALFRLTKMNLKLPNGKRKVVDIDGWVVGEDGIRGMPGLLKDPLGKAIGAGALAGGLQGLGDAAAYSQIERTRNTDGTYSDVLAGNTSTYAAGTAIAGAANQWGRIIEQRTRELVPHVQVFSGREATAVFSKSITIPDLYDLIAEETDIFASMD